MKFNTRYSEKAHATPFKFTKDSMTTQEYGFCTDINNIIEGCYNPFAQDPKDIVEGMQVFAPDKYQDALFLQAEAKSKFEQLPSSIRARFNNDPGQLLAFCSNSDNYEEGVKLGLFVEKETPTPVVTPPDVGVTPVTPVVSEA